MPPSLDRHSSIIPIFKRSKEEDSPETVHRPPRQIIPTYFRNELIAFLGEFVGTFMFLFIAFSATQIANTPPTLKSGEAAGLPSTPNSSNLLYISVAFGGSLMVNAWAFFRITGGLFNPAVTVALTLISALTPIRCVVVFIAQLLGGIAAAGVVSGLLPGPLLAATTLNDDTSIVRGLFIEMFLTAQLVFVIIMLAAEKHKATYLAPIGIGVTLGVSEMAGVYYTGGSLNPARSLGPAVVDGFPGYHWIYWLGPFMGSALAAGFYGLVKVGEYETVNPGQDRERKEIGIGRLAEGERVGGEVVDA